MDKQTLVVARILAVLLFVGAAGFAASNPAESIPKGSVEILTMDKPNIKRLPNGLYETQLKSGVRVVSHGYDPKAGFSGDWVTDDSVRQPVCATTQYYFHVLYGRKTGSTNRYTSSLPQILQSVKNSNWLLNQEALESGGQTADFKMACDQYGEVAVGQFTSSSASFDTVLDAAAAAGYNKSNVKYWIYFDASASVCGQGQLWPDDRLTVNNSNNSGTMYAVTYAGCWDGRTAMHEASHNMGAVQANAPNSTGNGYHCNEYSDVMCYSPDGGNKNQGGMWYRCLDHIHYDCGHDTYFDTDTESGEWLETHWNIGDLLNRFLVFDGEGSPTPANRPPIPAFTWRCPDATCYFDESSVDVDGTIASWSWNFGDGSTSIVRDASHTYTTSGTFSVTLTLTDNLGSIGTLSKQIAAYPTDPDPGTISLQRDKLRWEYAGGPGSWKYFKILLTEESERLTVRLDGPACTMTVVPCDRTLQTLPMYGFPGGANFDLYVRPGGKPSAATWICRPYDADSDETCHIDNPAGGIWYVGVNVVWRYSQQVPDGYYISMTY